MINTEILRKMLKYRLLNPSNATKQFAEYLKSCDIEITTGNRKYALIDDKKYALTITNANSEFLECRQFDGDGIISFYEKNGKIYLVNREHLSIKDVTREFNNHEYRDSKSRLKLIYLKPYSELPQIKSSLYKNVYMDVAKSVADSIIADTYRKIGGL